MDSLLYKKFALCLHEANYDHQLYLVPLTKAINSLLEKGYSIDSALIEAGAAMYGEGGIEVIDSDAIAVNFDSNKVGKALFNGLPQLILSEAEQKAFNNCLESSSIPSMPETWVPIELENFLYFNQKNKDWNRAIDSNEWEMKYSYKWNSNVWEHPALGRIEFEPKKRDIVSAQDYCAGAWYNAWKRKAYISAWLEAISPFLDEAIS